MKDKAIFHGVAVVVFIAVLSAGASPAQEAQEPEAGVEVRTSCIACHGDADLFDEEALAIVERFRKDIHAESGLSCHDCHGGNPDPALAEDLDLAMDEGFADNPYRGVPDRHAIPGFCGECHSDTQYMKRFGPDLRIDQEQRYWTSQHGIALQSGESRVATCVDCHAVHGILKATDPESPVYPTQVAETCRSCHSDSEHMAGVTLPDGRPISTDQYVLWRRSIHAEALLERGDLSAPTCNDCHGNHGAAPPGVESIAFVCGSCHGREARLFRESRKHAGLQQHIEYLEDAGADGCKACHEPPEPQAELTLVPSLAECAICHSNHAVVRATVAILANLPETPCAFCHEPAFGLAEEVPEPEQQQRHYEEMKAALLAAAADEGLLEGIELFNHLVDEALELPSHTFLPDGASDGKPQLRPEFRRLFEKFRIGKSYYTYENPDGGGLVTSEIYRCGHCHAPDGVSTSGGPSGLATAEQILEKMHELTALTARAERIVLRAKRGGVETREALAEIDKAVDAQIGLEVLVHAFRTEEGSAFAELQKEGLASARAALEAGQAALDELNFRRNWLAVFLVFVVLVAVGLALKIRELSRRERAADESRPA